MDEIPEHFRKLMRAQGMTDAQIEQLRQSGHFTSSNTADSSSVFVNGIEVKQGEATIPPDALERLRQFHSFIPADAIDQLEQMTGEDIDGDGRVGKFTGEPHPEHRPAPPAAPPTGDSHALPSATSGPFVQQRSGRGATVFAIVALVAAAIAVIVIIAAR